VVVSAIVVTYNSARHVGALLDSLANDPHGPDQTVVVDNGSSDATLSVLAEHGITPLPLSQNPGYGAACNAGARKADGDVLVFVTPDTRPHDGWIPPLVRTLSGPDVGAAMATIELLDQPGRFNTSGGVLTPVGLAWVSDHGEPVPPDDPGNQAAWPSGAAFAITADVFWSMGGFREDLFMYHEDTDLGWRLAMRGLHVVRVPDSTVAHDYDFGRNPFKMRHLERNRWRLLMANYRSSTRWLLAPVLLIADLGVTVVAARDGWLRAKLQALGDGVAYRSARDRRTAQEGRTVGDAPILRAMSWSMSGNRSVAEPPGVGLADAITSTWLKVVLPVIAWFDRRAGL